MKIDAYNQISSIYTAGPVRRTNRAGYTQSVQAAPADNLQISQLGRDFQTARMAVMNAPDVREDMVQIAKANLESGKYDNMSGASFADKLLKKYEESQAIA